MEYQIIATHIERISSTEYRCVVAIDAGNGGWKAYSAVLPEYPDWAAIQRVAAAGRRVTATAAKQVFGEVSQQFATYG
jgi:hypothetical protein